jgi:ATP-dependent Zn protease
MNAVHGAEVVAFHEAAHAALCHCFNLPVSSVEVSEDTGRCVPPSEWSLAFSDDGIRKLVQREGLFRLVVASCSGKAAMDRWYGWKSKSDDNWRASDDFKQAFKLALQINGGDEKGAELLIAWLARRAELLVERHWPQIHNLAFALLEREKLSGAEITQIMKTRHVNSSAIAAMENVTTRNGKRTTRPLSNR